MTRRIAFLRLAASLCAVCGLLAAYSRAESFEEWLKRDRESREKFTKGGNASTNTPVQNVKPPQPPPPPPEIKAPPDTTTKPATPPTTPPVAPPTAKVAPPQAAKPVAPATNDWLIMVYQAADNSLDEFATKDVEEMEKIGSNDRLKIVVLMDRLDTGKWTTTRRFLVRKPSEQNGKNSWDTSLPTCKDLGELNMGDPATLNAFVASCLEQYPAHNTMLVLWNHGGGWRSAVQKAVSRFTRGPADKVAPALAVLSRGIAWDDSNNGDFLESREVRAALSPLPKLSIIAADACLMAMIECAYEWRDLADYMVASEDIEPGDGWFYEPALKPLLSSPDLPPENLAANIVKTYGDSYAANRIQVTQSAIRLAKIQPLVEAFDGVASQLVAYVAAGNRVPQKMLEVPYFPGSASGAGFYDFMDLDSLLERIATLPEFPANLHASATEARKKLADAVLSNYSGQQLGGRGLTIYGGRTGEMADYRPDIIRFAADTKWDEFLRSGAVRGGAEGGGKAPERWAVLIGVDDYSDEKVPDLSYSANDVTSLRDALVGAGYATNRIIALLNKDATTERVRTVLGTELPRMVAPEDMVMIYFSGHGAAEPATRGETEDGTEKYMLLVNSKIDDLYGTALPMSELARIFGRIRADKLLVLMDSCYSGAAGGRGLMRGVAKSDRLSDEYLGRLAASKGTVVVTAARANELSLESPKLKHGVFTHFLLNVFKDAADTNNDGITTLVEAYQYLVANVTSEARNLGGSQQPVMKGEISGDWPLTMRAKPQP